MAQLLTTNTEAFVDGAAMLLQTDVHAIVGCPFTPVAYSPCVSVRWVSGATQTKVREVPVLLQTSVGLCLSAAQVPQGTVIVTQVQQRARGM
jgi:hypothetical protein